MYTIEYTVTGSYKPFMVILRNFDTDLLVDSNVLHESGTNQFNDIPFGTYIVEVYDSATGFDENSVAVTTTTTTTTTTTLPPTTITTSTTTTTTTSTTTTTTTLPPLVSPIVAYYGLGNGLARSNDGAITWSEDNNNFDGLIGSFTYQQVATSLNDIMVAGGSVGVLYSSDSGVTWNISNNNSFTIPMSIRGASGNQGDSKIYVWESEGNGNEDRVHYSTDNGENWAITSSFGAVAAGQKNINSMQSIDDNVVVGFNDNASPFLGRRVAGSTDGGVTWNNITPPSYTVSSLISQSIALPSPNTIYFTTGVGNEISKSTNFGASWSIIPTTNSGRIIHFIDDNTGILVKETGGDGQHIITTDGGATWSVINTISAPVVGRYVRGAYINNYQEYWIYTSEAGVMHQHYTSDGGAIFTDTTFTDNSITAKPSFIY